MQRLFLVRGLPGSGKSAVAREVVGADGLCFSAKDYFDQEPKRVYSVRKMPHAHRDCLERTRAALAAGHTVAVANTFARRWEMEPYLLLSRELGIPYVVIDLYSAGFHDWQLAQRDDRVHGAHIRAIRRNYERDWWNGDPTVLPTKEFATPALETP